MTRAPCRSRRRATNSALIQRSGYPRSSCRERFTEKARTLQPIAPWLVDRFGQADTRPSDHLERAVTGQEFEGRRIERQSILRMGDCQRLAESARSGAEQSLVVHAAPPLHNR